MAIRAKGYENRKGNKRLQVTMDRDEGKVLVKAIPATVKNPALKALREVLDQATR